MKNKKAIEWHELGLWMLILLALVLIVIGIILLKGKGFNLLDKLKEILRFSK